ncbi:MULTISPECIES: radical SAM family heme chaperone HemW [Tissierellales]|jgi:oxygen-independent coproporphyrinogen-3 oxidase|uniref:Heme chaperone HemW n=1 Tax=Acidilutibacter cellobiosedens TaxID=2507161 RepID=A0A410QDQ0_9FIRM|nr:MULTISPECIES: radical SAM family heme chaperone HemW [Tissierellales]MBE6081310.1 oxygen-independent coproporphyrinogen III oxidase [Tissierellaceae bacterium]QAT62162.1 oxygen-independent coproporphyrinogen III oxidase [Acidilutibacter cellobiosedens]SCL84397.1 Oxygen-independent coproporphyrinogen-III oxidase 1 [Sporanaerobacter sp. PP17-6a]
MDDLALYVHIPFCLKKCNYCDFISFPNKFDYVEKYTDALVKEIRLYSSVGKKFKLNTVFIGGGTPSSINSIYIEKIMDGIYKYFDTNELKEVTIETNPKTLDKEKLVRYRESGINRISMGVQTLNDNLLKILGRIHNTEDFYKNYDLVRNLGFNNVNLDLMFGLPFQTLEDVIYTLKEVIKLEPTHLSFYGLIVEKGTKFYDLNNRGKLNLPDEDLERAMYHKGMEYLVSNGYEHYEISNFAKKGYECKHNLFYWELKPYIGLGIGAHSNIFGKRYWNFADIKEYISSLDNGSFPVSGEEVIDKDMEMAEYCILGLRLIRGIDKKNFLGRFGIDIKEIYGKIIERHVKGGLLYENENRIYLTKRGLDLSNIVEVDFLP